MAKGWSKGKKPRKQQKKKGLRAVFFVFFAMVMALTGYTLYQLDQKIMPAILAATDMNTKSKVNMAINDALARAINEKSLESKDFFEKSEDEDGKINALSVNTVLVNQLCNEIAVDISTGLNEMESQRISLPVGSILGINAFANTGPKYTITVLPMGDAIVDYSSSFESVGINQINFQIWLDIETKIQVINPLQNTEVAVTRKVALVNTVFSGEVPPTYLNTTQRSGNKDGV